MFSQFLKQECNASRKKPDRLSVASSEKKVFMKSSPKILIVDDSDANLDLLEATLSLVFDVEFVRAENGEQALAALSSQEMALAILDVNMPGMTGFELAESIYRETRTQHLPIIFLSAEFTDDSSILVGYTRGAVDYLTKPFKKEILQGKVKVFLNLYQQRKALEDEIKHRIAIEAELNQIKNSLENLVEERTVEVSRSNESLRKEMVEREKTQEMLRKNEEKYRSMIESMDDMAYIGSEDHQIVFANTAFLKQKGRDVVGKRCYKVLHDLDKPCSFCSWDKIKKSEHVKTNIWSPGDHRYYQVSNSPVNMADGSIHKLAIYRDTTAEKEAEEKLVHAKQKAEQASQAKSEFLANISHELRTPLHHILSFSRFGLKKTKNIPQAEIREYFNSILESGMRLFGLVDNLLNLSRLESKKTDYKMEKTRLKDIIGKSIIEWQSTADEKGILIEMEDSGIPTDLVCDIQKITQAIGNLLSNAIKFTPPEKKITVSIEPGGLPSKFRLDNKDSGSTLCVKIIDNGIGIPEDERETIFDPFIQSSKTKTGAGGKGLGLALCREIIHAHNGKIRAENNPEGGATFSFILPCQI